MATRIPRALPSRRWASFEGWDYNGTKERLQNALEKIDKSALINHAELIKGQRVTMSQPFSVGQYWACFEMIAEDGSLIIARARLPRHPDSPSTISEEDEEHAIACEIATMKFVRKRLSTIPFLTYMHTKVQDRSVPLKQATTQEHIMTQWTTMQAEHATLAYPQIGSISSILPSDEPVIGKLAAFTVGETLDPGPFITSAEYFISIANAAIERLDSIARLGAFIFRDIVQQTTLFGNMDNHGLFPLNHMDLGTQNILVDNDFNFLAIIDWEFAQTAPWQVNRFPMPFPLLQSDFEDILQNPNHLAYKNVVRQDFSQKLYTQKFRSIEKGLQEEGQPLGGSFADALYGPASRIYACFSNLGRIPEVDKGLIGGMVKLAFSFDIDVEKYAQEVERTYC
ncbi:hypothetical protein PT974_02252 [Cladobotryum mycophilum]|uniref:Aminoglycoside phosphotransferase domain-containing protein n=1 Tax=Cladobotryum mycophilum TaxID=491253 RepID=A0ABR0SYR4_9HYPO